MIPERDRDTSKRAENVHHVRSKGSSDGSRGSRERKNVRVTGIMKQQLEIAILPSYTIVASRISSFLSVVRRISLIYLRFYFSAGAFITGILLGFCFPSQYVIRIIEGNNDFLRSPSWVYLWFPKKIFPDCPSLALRSSPRLPAWPLAVCCRRSRPGEWIRFPDIDSESSRRSRAKLEAAWRSCKDGLQRRPFLRFSGGCD